MSNIEIIVIAIIGALISCYILDMKDNSKKQAMIGHESEQEQSKKAQKEQQKKTIEQLNRINKTIQKHRQKKK